MAAHHPSNSHARQKFRTVAEFLRAFSGDAPIRSEAETAAAWKLFRINWFLLTGIVAVFVLGLLLSDFHPRPPGYLTVFAIALFFGLCGYYIAISPLLRNPRIAFALIAIAQIIPIVAVLTSISYIAASANLPLRDEALLAVDRALGFDFRSYLHFLYDRPRLVSLLSTAYGMIGWQMFLVVLGLPLAGHYRRTGQFICGFTLTLVTTICISTLVPAIGVYNVLQIGPSDFPYLTQGDGYPRGYADTLRMVPGLRNGAMRTLDAFQLAGVLTFPSFHAASAVLYAWAFWPILWLRPLNCLVNSTMIAATPVGGGHFLVDVMAGIIIAAASIRAASHFGQASVIPDLRGATPSSSKACRVGSRKRIAPEPFEGFVEEKRRDA